MCSEIDVIVPVYNVEAYLPQCLNSLITQNMRELRLICVDDGSTDRSPQLLRQFAEMDDRILLIQQKNRGYGAAVNNGLSVANAEYIGIVEPDDFVDPFCFERLHQLAKVDGGVDIAKCAYNDFYDAADGTHRIKASDSSDVESYLSPFEIAQYPALLLYHPSIWSGIYRRKFLEEHRLHFVEAPGAAWTDNPFFISTMCLAKKIVWSNERHYYYRRSNPNSSSNLKDCSIPLMRNLDILHFVETTLTLKPVVLQAIFKRCLIHIRVATENPTYVPEVHAPLIRQTVSRIPYRCIDNAYFTDQERSLHRIFSTKDAGSRG